MATSLNPFGFLPARKRDGQPNTEGYGQIVQPVSNSAIGIVSLIPNDIYAGDVIAIDAGGTNQRLKPGFAIIFFLCNFSTKLIF